MHRHMLITPRLESLGHWRQPMLPGINRLHNTYSNSVHLSVEFNPKLDRIAKRFDERPFVQAWIVQA